MSIKRKTEKLNETFVLNYAFKRRYDKNNSRITLSLIETKGKYKTVIIILSTKSGTDVQIKHVRKNKK